jgi:hypothetical protein
VFVRRQLRPLLALRPGNPPARAAPLFSRVATARTAYTQGMSVAGVRCALVFGGLAVPVTHSFRETRSDAPQMDGKPFSATNRPLGDR